MSTDVLLPQWGMGMNEGQVVKWLKKEGDPVVKGDALVEIESAKVNSEVEAPADGVLGKILVPEGTDGSCRHAPRRAAFRGGRLLDSRLH